MQRINEDIKTGNFKQIYLLYGEERYLKNQYTTRLRKALCQDGDEMNTHFYQGKDFSLGQVIDLAETLPFLAERRVMFFKDTGLFKAGGEKLAEYLANPNDTTFLCSRKAKWINGVNCIRPCSPRVMWQNSRYRMRIP